MGSIRYTRLSNRQSPPLERTGQANLRIRDYLCSPLDGYSGYLLQGEIREAVTQAKVEIILQRARERFPQARPRIIADNGPQFIARDFQGFIRLCGMTHVRTSLFYPPSNGKIER